MTDGGEGPAFPPLFSITKKERRMRFNAPLIMALGLAAGLAAPDLARLTAPAVAPLMAGVLFATVLCTDSALAYRHVRRPVKLLATLTAIFVAAPAVVAVIVAVVPLSPTVAQALLLNAATPPILGAPAVAMLLALDYELALACMAAATLASPVTLGVMGGLVLPVEAGIDPLATAERVGWLTVAPITIGFALQRVIGRARLSAWAGALRAAVVWGLAIIAVGLMDGANIALARDPISALAAAMTAAAFNIGHQAAVYLLLRWFKAPDAAIVAIMTGNRNLGLTLGGLGENAGEFFAAYVAAGQLPIYLTPAVWRRLLKNGGVPKQGVNIHEG